MIKMSLKKISLLFLLVFLGYNRSAWANQSLGNGWQLSLLGSYHFMLYNEFPQASFFLPGQNTALPVEIASPLLSEDDFGFGGRLGYKGKSWGLDFQYTQNYMTTSSSNIMFNFYDINAKHYILQHAAIKSYMILGLSFSQLVGDQFKQMPDSTLQPASYSGWSYNLGLGFSYYLNNSFFIFSDYIYRGLSYYYIEDHKMDEPISRPLHCFNLGIGLVLGAK